MGWQRVVGVITPAGAITRQLSSHVARDVSRNTVSTQTDSIYRKLAVSGRSEAIDRARELGLLAPSVLG